MYPKITFKPNSLATATRNRRRAGSNDFDTDFDTRRNVLCYRRRCSSTLPYPIIKSTHNKYEECLDDLSTRVNRIEEVVKILSKTVETSSSSSSIKKTSFSSAIFNSEIVDFSKMDVNELVSFSNRLRICLLGNHDIDNSNQQKDEAVAPKANNRMNISAIINNTIDTKEKK
ncbi:206_t:CDS:1 [Diversispora eburnea]|uniref:206_t:CDS:1 n=1 Tax=Diversispora eburnea TaxID=1213867 RepID=A0A9N8W5U1_9GLOM|nr:206_t:CDS:1 [Diversispora eburnea]